MAVEIHTQEARETGMVKYGSCLGGEQIRTKIGKISKKIMCRATRAQKKEQGIKKSHNRKCDKAIVFYDQPKRPAQGARIQEILIFIRDFATP